MTVQELMVKLGQLPADLPVAYYDGDSGREPVEVVIERANEVVLI